MYVHNDDPLQNLTDITVQYRGIFPKKGGCFFRTFTKPIHGELNSMATDWPRKTPHSCELTPPLQGPRQYRVSRPMSIHDTYRVVGCETMYICNYAHAYQGISRVTGQKSIPQGLVPIYFGSSGYIRNCQLSLPCRCWDKINGVIQSNMVYIPIPHNHLLSCLVLTSTSGTHIL